jgi:hypothetical protein
MERLDPVERNVGGRDVKLSRYVYTAGGVDITVWLDPAGKLLLADVPSHEPPMSAKARGASPCARDRSADLEADISRQNGCQRRRSDAGWHKAPDMAKGWWADTLLGVQKPVSKTKGAQLRRGQIPVASRSPMRQALRKLPMSRLSLTV